MNAQRWRWVLCLPALALGVGPAVQAAELQVPRDAPAVRTVLHVDSNSTVVGESDGSEANPYRNIQAAIDAVRGPTTIYVEPGVYEGRVRIDKSGIHLEARSGPQLDAEGFLVGYDAKVVVRGKGAADECTPCVGGYAGVLTIFEADQVVVRGFTIESADPRDQLGARIIGIHAVRARDVALTEIEVGGVADPETGEIIEPLAVAGMALWGTSGRVAHNKLVGRMHGTFITGGQGDPVLFVDHNYSEGKTSAGFSINGGSFDRRHGALPASLTVTSFRNVGVGGKIGYLNSGRIAVDAFGEQDTVLRTVAIECTFRGGVVDVRIAGGGRPAVPAKPGTVNVAVTFLSNNIDLSDDLNLSGDIDPSGDRGRVHVAFGAEELSRFSIVDPQGSLSGASYDTGGEAAGNRLFYNSEELAGEGVLAAGRSRAFDRR